MNKCIVDEQTLHANTELALVFLGNSKGIVIHNAHPAGEFIKYSDCIKIR